MKILWALLSLSLLGCKKDDFIKAFKESNSPEKSKTQPFKSVLGPLESQKLEVLCNSLREKELFYKQNVIGKKNSFQFQIKTQNCKGGQKIIDAKLELMPDWVFDGPDSSVVPKDFQEKVVTINSNPFKNYCDNISNNSPITRRQEIQANLVQEFKVVKGEGGQSSDYQFIITKKKVLGSKSVETKKESFHIYTKNKFPNIQGVLKKYEIVRPCPRSMEFGARDSQSYTQVLREADW